MPTKNINKPDAEAPEKTVKKTTAKKTTAKRAAGTTVRKRKTSAEKAAEELELPARVEGTKLVFYGDAAETGAEENIRVIDPDIVELHTITEAMLEKKAQNVCSLDLREIGTSICDYFIICNADSTTNVLAIADNVEERMLMQCKRKVMRKQGQENAFWIILDFSNIVVHIFQTRYREFYRLEDLWADSVKTTYGE